MHVIIIFLCFNRKNSMSTTVESERLRVNWSWGPWVEPAKKWKTGSNRFSGLPLGLWRNWLTWWGLVKQLPADTQLPLALLTTSQVCRVTRASQDLELDTITLIDRDHTRAGRERKYVKPRSNSFTSPNSKLSVPYYLFISGVHSFGRKSFKGRRPIVRSKHILNRCALWRSFRHSINEATANNLFSGNDRFSGV